jgi:hypothetical protein
MSDIVAGMCPMHTCLQWKLYVESHSLASLVLFSIYKSAVPDYLVLGKNH